MRTLAAVALVAGLVTTTIGPGSAIAAPPEQNYTTVVRGDTYTEFFADDICGPRAAYVTFTFRPTVFHLTQRRDGSLIFTGTDGGTYHVDFVDPSLKDLDGQFRSTVSEVVTRNGNEIVTWTLHDFTGGIKVWNRFHGTFANGEVKVEREVTKVTGCP